MSYWVARWITLVVLRAIFPIQVFGREHIPQKGGFILAGNHVSYLDPLVLGSACPRRLDYMAKEELFYNRLFSWILYQVGCFPVKRDSADLSALKQAIRRVRQGNGLLLFPEGSRRFDGDQAQPHAGIGFLAAKLNVPVVPGFVQGTDLALPKGGRFIRRVKISVYFGHEISIDRNLPYQDIAQTIMVNIRQLEKNS